MVVFSRNSFDFPVKLTIISHMKRCIHSFVFQINGVHYQITQGGCYEKNDCCYFGSFVHSSSAR